MGTFARDLRYGVRQLFWVGQVSGSGSNDYETLRLHFDGRVVTIKAWQGADVQRLRMRLFELRRSVELRVGPWLSPPSAESAPRGAYLGAQSDPQNVSMSAGARR